MYRAIQHKRSIYWAAAIVFLTGVALFSPGGLYFLNDDLIHIPLSSKLILMQRHSWRPICDLTVALDWYLWKQAPWGYHLTALLIHVINTVLVGAFVHTLFAQYMPNTPQKLLVARLCALLFFIYAFHSEAIFWVIGRAAALVMIFALPAFIFYLKRNVAQYYIWLSALFFHLAMLTYESVWIFPILTIIFSAATIYKKGGKWKAESLHLTFIWVSFIIHLTIRFIYLGEVAGNYEASHFKAFNLVALASNYAKLLLRTFLPPVQQNWQFLLCGLILIIIVLIILYRIRKTKLPFLIPVLAAVCLLTSYLPYLSLGMDTHGVESERYLYMPSVFAALLIAWCIAVVFTRVALPLFLSTAIYHLIFLYISRTYFLHASSIAQATFVQVNLLSDKRRLFIDSLPDEVRGALIFRLGFTEGIGWLKNDKTVDSVIVLSRKINDIGDENFSNKKVETVINPADDMRGKLQRYRYNALAMDYSADTIFLFNPATDAYFRYEKGNWLIWK